MQMPFTGRQKITLLGFGIIIMTIAIGVAKFGFYLQQLAAVFFIGMIITGLINGMGPSKSRIPLWSLPSPWYLQFL